MYLLVEAGYGSPEAGDLSGLCVEAGCDYVVVCSGEAMVNYGVELVDVVGDDGDLTSYDVLLRSSYCSKFVTSGAGLGGAKCGWSSRCWAAGVLLLPFWCLGE